MIQNMKKFFFKKNLSSQIEERVKGGINIKQSTGRDSPLPIVDTPNHNQNKPITYKCKLVDLSLSMVNFFN